MGCVHCAEIARGEGVPRMRDYNFCDYVIAIIIINK